MKPQNSINLIALTILVFGSMFFASCTKEVLREQKGSISAKMTNQDATVVGSGCYPGIPDYSRVPLEGLYIIQSKANPNMVLEVPTVNTYDIQNQSIVRQNPYNGRVNQIWKVKFVESVHIWGVWENIHYYSISPYLDDTKTLDVPNGSFAPYLKMQVYNKKLGKGPDTYNQQWRIDGKGGIVTIQNRQSTLFLNTPNVNAGVQVQQWVLGSTWKFIPVPPAEAYIPDPIIPQYVTKYILNPTTPGCYTSYLYNVTDY